ncbi:GntR family transcriptional regulator [Herbaspirillum autotrophicum]|uniref:GntR family transcriptional regulator n=1 Tax=Herbaspirillum autotrophicum TaxID=180195 RepID=UPI00067C4697|nr:GntR family transcriptional regulator [Herbaspirillum autotrophicum]
MNADHSIKSSIHIASRITEAILARQLAPGTRLGEQQLCELFGVSRTLIREALTRLVTRGIVTVVARRGWFVIEPSANDAREAFEARRIIELGLLRNTNTVSPTAIARLHEHLRREQAAIDGHDAGARCYLLGDFHVCLCECLGNTLLSETLRDLTARTTLTAMLHQSSEQAEDSCVEHVEIVAALASGDLRQAETLMLHHLQHVESGLRRSAISDPLDSLRTALAPVASAPTLIRTTQPAAYNATPTTPPTFGESP